MRDGFRWSRPVRRSSRSSGVEKAYRTGKLEYPALRGVDLTVERGDLVAVVGPSGSGKTTILKNMITGIDRPTAGSVTVAGRCLDAMGEEELAGWRGENVGVVFQFFQLLPTLTALDAMLPLDFARRGGRRERLERARRNLELVGLADKLDQLPAELSGGEQRASRSRAPSRPTRRSSSGTSRRGTWTRRRPLRCSACCNG